MYSDSGEFPSSDAWKRLINKYVREYVVDAWKSRLTNDTLGNKFFEIHSEYSPSMLWKFCQLYPEYKVECFSAVNLLSKYFSQRFVFTCRKCGLNTENITTHLLLFCHHNDNCRVKFWDKLVNIVGQEAFLNLCSQSPDYQIQEMFAGFVSIIPVDYDKLRVSALKIFLRFVHFSY